MKLALYYAPLSCATIPYITLTETGTPFEVINVNLRKDQQNSAEFLRLNPKHKVPVLLIDGEPLTENVAIQIWIARNFPAARLLPAAPKDEIQAISLMAWFGSALHPRISPLLKPSATCDTPGSEEGVKRMAQRQLREDLAVADRRLAGREWFFDHFTAVDAYFFWCYRRAQQLKAEVGELPHCRAHFERMQERPSVRKVVAYEKEVSEQFARAA